ncbi:hypothetical protein [Bacillus sp. J37]|uniref:hypothetical protein n=1 Tax=Bacillus sp. J37 TaxID=935837 RepID=UPI0004B44C0C|nr:hypothetical protein [Bacillus sp. J37]
MLCIDPYLTCSIEEKNQILNLRERFHRLDPAMLQELDGVLVTHGHDDHLDVPSL